MPTLLLQEGFKFFIYANEHLPKHIHVTKGNGYAKFDLATLDVHYSCLRPAELKRALTIAAAHRSEFVRKWDEFFSQG